MTERRDWWRLLLLLFICGGLYANSLGGSFHYDDFHSIVDNPGIRELAAVGDFFRDTTYFSVDREKQMYRPLLLVTFAVNYTLGGYDVSGYHLVNIALHGLCAVLVWALGLRLRLGQDRAFVCALLFAVHPIAAEPANYISSRSELLMAAFFLFACLAHVTHACSGRRCWYIAAVVGAALTLLSKSVGLVLIGVVVTCDCHLLGWTAARRRWLAYLPYLALSLAYVLFSWSLVDRALSTRLRSVPTQFLTQVEALVYYIKLLVVPWGLNVEHQFFEAIPGGVALLSLLLLLSVVFLLWWGRRGRLAGGVTFGLAWCGLVLVPTFVTPLNMLVNERRLYLAAVGLIWALVRLVPDHLLHLRRGRLLLLLPLLLALLTWERNLVWASELTLWRDAVAKAPEMYRAQTNLGKALHLAGETDAALACYHRALAIDDRHGDAYNNIATILHADSKRLAGAGEKAASARRLAEAIGFYHQAVERYPNYEEIHQNLADAYAQAGDLDRAIAHYERALDINRRNGGIWNNFGQTLSAAGRTDEAEVAFTEAARLLPEQAEPFNNLGNLYHGRGLFKRAVEQYERALQRQSSTREKVLENLADTYLEMERLEEALDAVEEALRLAQKSPVLHLLRGRIERRADDLPAAIASLERAIELDRGMARAYAELGETYALAGSHERAAAVFLAGHRVDSGYSRVLYGAALSFEALDQGREALAAYRAFTESWPHRDKRRDHSRRRMEALAPRFGGEVD